MDFKGWAANNLAARLLAGPWTRQDIATSIASVLGPGDRRERRLLATSLAAFAEGTYPPAPHALTAFLLQSPFFRAPRDRKVAAVLAPARFAPLPVFTNLQIPALATPGDLADWLGETTVQLGWLADERCTHGRTADPTLQHYRYSFIAKNRGVRLLEAPKPRLKSIQRRILHEILDVVPLHDAAHGFAAGRSCLTGAQIHAGESVVATFDLVQFFPSISAPRVHGIFRSLGYPWAVARRLTGLCTTATPANVRLRIIDPTSQALLAVPHLPQGAPTSPALANLLAFTLDTRLHGLARAAGANYTRYADDLAFSGPPEFARSLTRFINAVETIVADEGFSLNQAKTRVMPRHTRQRITGIIVNDHCNTPRAEFEFLKSILYNCTLTGPETQNRAAIPNFRAHLEGRIGWIAQINPQRAIKLYNLFDNIDWTQSQNGIRAT
jgi:hypothetical protein